jgi:hypothetical protein
MKLQKIIITVGEIKREREYAMASFALGDVDTKREG